MSLRISLYYYEKTHNIINKDRLLTEELELRPNYIANILGCNTDNYKEKINSSFFIGIFEKINESFKLFVKLIESKEVTLPKENVSQKDKQEKNFTSQQIKNFKENNKLDYLIWDYCLKKYETLKNKYL
ncbi:MAG: hypothetical protein DRJ01_12410 [Bacteroidetes bacterium]|nr:MAG: hypothetical protein DRJ01_12410 [Bacteroidota bacterium]